MPSYEWSRIHKNEDFYEQQIIEDVIEHICEWFTVEDVTELSEEQINEVIAWREDILNDRSVMQVGYSIAISRWEDENS